MNETFTMHIDNIFDCVLEELSGKLAKEHTQKIAQFHRIQASPGFLEAAKYVQAELKKIGISKTKIWSFPADGKTRSWTWEAPVAWTIKDACLKLIEPEKRLLIRFKETPHGVITHSQKTDVIAEVIDVGEGLRESDYKNKKIAGKIVLTTGRASEVHKLAIKHGAIGLIVYPTPEKATANTDLIIYSSLWPSAKERKTITFGFSISERQTNILKSYLAQGKKVKVHAKVDAKLYNGQLNVLSAEIPGSSRPKEAVVLIAHLCHPKPSANDNASGSGLLMEIIRTIKHLITQGKIPKPKRTIRFLWVPEFHGTVSWLLANRAKSKNTLILLNLDMVGESPKEIGSPLYLIQSPYSISSYLNDFISYLLNKVAGESKAVVDDGYKDAFNYRLRPFSGGSDHTLFVDNFFGVPAVMFFHPDKFHHTHLDNINMVDSTELKRIGIVASTAILSVANANDEIVTRLALLTQSSAFSKLANHTAESSRKLLGFSKEKNKDSSVAFFNTFVIEKDKLRFLVEHAIKSLQSVKISTIQKYLEDFINSLAKQIAKFGHDEENHLLQLYKSLCQRLKIRPGHERFLSIEIKQSKKIIPRRNYNGPIASRVFTESQNKKANQWLKDSPFKVSTSTFLEILNFTNGTNSVYDIYIALASEFPKMDIKLPDVAKFFKIVQEMKIVRMC